MILLLSWNTMYRAIFLVFLFWFATIHPTWMCKRNCFLKFWVLRETSSDIASFVKYLVYSNFKLYSVLILVTLILICSCSPKVNVLKRIFPEILGALRKNQWYCFFRGALCIAISKCIVSCSNFFILISHC